MFLLGIPGEHPEGVSAVGSEGTAADACAHPSLEMASPHLPVLI